MPLADIIQRIVHFLDVGKGPKVFRGIVVGLVLTAVLLWYDVHQFKGFSAPEAMDAAQLARNIADGQGYTTDFVRPLSIFLERRWNQQGHLGQPVAASTDFARLQKHPDLENPPLYPFFLAGLMKILPFHFQMEFRKVFWSDGGHFSRYQPEFLISLGNQVLMVIAVLQLFFIARKLFDVEVAWVSAILMLGCDLLWQFSLAGLSTMLVIVVFLALTRILMAFEEAARVPAPQKSLLLAVAVGALAGVGALTQYSFGWVIVPATIFIAIYGGPGSGRFGLAAVAGFIVVLLPWAGRNYWVSGVPFGTAGFAVMTQTSSFPGFRLEQALHPDLTLGKFVNPYFHKLWPNFTALLQNDLPTLGHSWVTLFFLVGLLLPFRGLAVRRARVFLLLCLAVFFVVQPLAHTGLADLAPEINADNLLIIFVPLVLMFGTVCFFTLLGQFETTAMMHPGQFRYSIISLFVAVMSFPFLNNLVAGQSHPISYPPYYPPEIEMSADWLHPDELMMSDVPWAVAWYGHRQCVWLTWNSTDSFYELNDYVKPVHALYLSPVTLNQPLMIDTLQSPANSWVNFGWRALTGGDISAFPLTHNPGQGMLNSGVYLTDRPRWIGFQNQP